MRYEALKCRVAAAVYDEIANLRTGEVTGVALLAALGHLLEGRGELKPVQLTHDLAEEARRRVMNWDIRLVGKLRELFPRHFPRNLMKGELVCEYDDRGEWVVNRG